jgi:hypothetical protein
VAVQDGGVCLGGEESRRFHIQYGFETLLGGDERARSETKTLLGSLAETQLRKVHVLPPLL